MHRSGLDVLGAEGSATLPPDPAVAVGDWLMTGAGGTVGPLPRRSLLTRRAPGRTPGLQTVAANLDTVFVTTSCNAEFNRARLERALALVFAGGCAPVIVLTKPDLAPDPAPFLTEAAGIAPGVPARAVDATGAGARAALEPWCGPGRTVGFMGSSGVGKSTLLNALAGRALAETGAIRESDARGRHTTTRRELHLVAGGFSVIDTPGMRELQLARAGDGIAAVFADIAALSAGCRFRDCAHQREPGCAVRGAVDPDRLSRWRKLVEEDARNTEALGRRDRR